MKEEDIHTAARKGDVTAVELIVSSNPLAINSRDKHSRTPLHLAAWAGHANVVSSLCKHKADVGASAMDDMAAIHFASQNGHLDVVKTLVSAGVSLKATTRKGLTALHYAVQGSHVELIKYLLRKGFNLNAKTKAGKTVPELAKNEEIRTLLVDYEKSKETEVNVAKETGGDGGVDESGGESVEKTKEVDLEETSEENPKRKVEEEEGKDSLPKPKKSKVALNHLLASDDTQEDEEE